MSSHATSNRGSETGSDYQEHVGPQYELAKKYLNNSSGARSRSPGGPDIDIEKLRLQELMARQSMQQPSELIDRIFFLMQKAFL